MNSIDSDHEHCNFSRWYCILAHIAFPSHYRIFLQVLAACVFVCIDSTEPEKEVQ